MQNHAGHDGRCAVIEWIRRESSRRQRHGLARDVARRGVKWRCHRRCRVDSSTLLQRALTHRRDDARRRHGIRWFVARRHRRVGQGRWHRSRLHLDGRSVVGRRVSVHGLCGHPSRGHDLGAGADAGVSSDRLPSRRACRLTSRGKNARDGRRTGRLCAIELRQWRRQSERLPRGDLCLHRWCLRTKPRLRFRLHARRDHCQRLRNGGIRALDPIGRRSHRSARWRGRGSERHRDRRQRVADR